VLTYQCWGFEGSRPWKYQRRLAIILRSGGVVHSGRRRRVTRRQNAEPTIAKAINGGFDLLEAKCNHCDRVSLVALGAVRQPPDTPVWKLNAIVEPIQPQSNAGDFDHRGRRKRLPETRRRPH